MIEYQWDVELISLEFTGYVLDEFDHDLTS